MRLIDADELKTLYDDAEFVGEKWHVPIRVILANIDDMPTIDSTEHGHWVEDHRYYDLKCSNCGERPLYYFNEEELDYYPCRSKYCPNCGAKMGINKSEFWCALFATWVYCDYDFDKALKLMGVVKEENE